MKSDGVEGDVVQRFRSYQEPPIRLRLYQGLAKGDKMDFVIQKAVELGVKEIVPFTSQYTVVKLEASAAEKRLRRWQRIADEAAKQCLRAELPVVRPLISFEQVLADLKEGPKDKLVLLPYEHEEKQGIKSVPTGEWGAVSIIIGPEGGFHPAEVEAARENGAKVVSLGPRILRTETAGLVALSLVGYRWGIWDSAAEKTIAVCTLGCKVNQYDSDAVLVQFRDAGYEVVDFHEKADVYLINTCTVTNTGDRKSRQMIRRAHRANPKARVVVMGCLAQASPEEIVEIEG